MPGKNSRRIPHLLTVFQKSAPWSQTLIGTSHTFYFTSFSSSLLLGPRNLYLAKDHPVACLDSRCKPYEVLVIRNVGGCFDPTSADIAAFDCLLDINRIILLQHNDSASTFLTKDQVVEDVKAKRPDVSEEQVAQLRARLAMRVDDESGLVSGMADMRRYEFLRRDLVEGIVGLYLDVDIWVVRVVKE